MTPTNPPSMDRDAVLRVLEREQSGWSEDSQMYRDLGHVIAQIAALYAQRDGLASQLAELVAVAECEEALDSPPDKARPVLERYGWSDADRFDLPASEFVRRMRRAALARSTP